MARRTGPHIVALSGEGSQGSSSALPGGPAMTVLSPANDLSAELRAKKPDLIVVDWKQREALDRLGGKPGAPVLIVRDFRNVARDLQVVLDGYQAARRVKPAPSTQTIPDLHEPGSGRLHAARVGQFFGLSLSEMARIAGRSPQAVHKTPDAKSLQVAFAPLHRIALALKTLFQTPAKARIWLNTPHPDLDDTPPIELIRERKAEVVVDLLEDALLGHPG